MSPLKPRELQSVNPFEAWMAWEAEHAGAHARFAEQHQIVKRMREDARWLTEEGSLSMVESWVEEAKKSQIPIGNWVLPAQVSYRQESWVMEMAQRANKKKALELLEKEGVNPWWTAKVSKRIEPGRGVSEELILGVATGRAMLDLCWPESVEEARVKNPSARRLLWRMALQSAWALSQSDPWEGAEPGESEPWEDFERMARERAETIFEKASGGDGVLGKADKQALEVAKMIEETASLWKRPPWDGAAQEKWEEMELKAARIRHLKEKPAQKGFNPEALKRMLTPEQKARLRTLKMMLRLSDPPAWEAVKGVSGWLSSMPQAACLKVGGESLMKAALIHGHAEALAWMESMGSNVWMAAAQEGSANPVAWMADEHFARGDGSEKRTLDPKILSICARLLVYGAFLSGANDPIKGAIEKIDQAPEWLEEHSWAGEKAKAWCQAIRGQVEALGLEEVLAGKPETEAKGAGLKKRRAL